jgi:hypothetical protein
VVSLHRSGDGACRPGGCAIDGSEKVGVRVFDSHRSYRPDFDLNLAPLVQAAAVPVDVGEANKHALDPVSEPTERKPASTAHMCSQRLAHLDVALGNLNPHLCLQVT